MNTETIILNVDTADKPFSLLHLSTAEMKRCSAESAAEDGWLLVMDKELFFELFSQTRVYDLEQPRSSGAPLLPVLVPGFTYTLHRRHEEGPGDPRTAASGFIATTEHAGTHIDALCHVAEDLCLYGGEKVTFRIQTPTGFTRLGAETIAPLLSRGVLLDVVGYRGVDWITTDQPISRQDLETVYLHQNVTLHEGDVALVRTGNGTRWHDPSGYLRSGGVRADASQWLADQHVRAVSADHISWDTDGRVDPDLGTSLMYEHGANHSCDVLNQPLEVLQKWVNLSPRMERKKDLPHD